MQYIKAIYLIIMMKLKYRAGQVYCYKTESGKYKVMKILKVGIGIHIRIYQDAFKMFPKEVSIPKLKLEFSEEKDGFSIGHMPVTYFMFMKYNPIFIKKENVNDEEMEGYKEWKSQNGGYFN